MWEVLKITGKRIRNGITEYEVHWNTIDDQVSWECEDNLDSCQESIKEFQETLIKNPNKYILNDMQNKEYPRMLY